MGFRTWVDVPLLPTLQFASRMLHGGRVGHVTVCAHLSLLVPMNGTQIPKFTTPCPPTYDCQKSSLFVTMKVPCEIFVALLAQKDTDETHTHGNCSNKTGRSGLKQHQYMTLCTLNPRFFHGVQLDASVASGRIQGIFNKGLQRQITPCF